MTNKKLLYQWVLVGIVVTMLSGLIYLALQQYIRAAANDPQIQISEDMARSLENGQSIQQVLPPGRVDLTKTLYPFVVFYDESSKPVAGTGLLNGELPKLPQGVFDYAREKKQNRLTWEPQPGYRFAAVITHYGDKNGGFVMAVRSLREVEKREWQLLMEVLVGWAVTLIVTYGSMIVYEKLATPQILKPEVSNLDVS